MAQGVGLPARMKALSITTLNRSSDWLSQAFAADSATQIELEEAVGTTAGVARMRDEPFDAVLVTHEPSTLDALELIEGWRAGGGDEPIVVLGELPPQQIDALCFEAGADDYCCIAETTVRSLLWKLARAVDQCRLRRENRRLLQSQQQRLQQEHQEAQRLLEHQRALVADLGLLSNGGAAGAGPSPAVVDDCLAKSAAAKYDRPLDLPSALADNYRELLRAYVIMGAGNLGAEMAKLIELLAAAEVSAGRVMHLHVEVLEELVQGLGNRSARHVMSRADLLVLEVMSHLADGYRQRYHERSDPPRQLLLPYFDASAETGHVFYRAAA